MSSSRQPDHLPIPADTRHLCRTLAALCVVHLGLVNLAGCGSDTAIRPGDIRTYTAPRSAVSSPTAASGPGLASTAPDSPRLRYELPDGWAAGRSASGMRLATVLIGDPHEEREVTVIPASGSLRSNVERWQGQLGGASDTDSSQAAVERALAEARTVEVNGVEATVVLLFDARAAAGEDGEAILGAMVPVDESTALFVKFKGDAAVARREHDNFSQFVSSLRWN